MPARTLEMIPDSVLTRWTMRAFGTLAAIHALAKSTRAGLSADERVTREIGVIDRAAQFDRQLAADKEAFLQVGQMAHDQRLLGRPRAEPDRDVGLALDEIEVVVGRDDLDRDVGWLA